MFLDMTVIGFRVGDVLWYFLICSFLGVIVEMIYCLAKYGVVEARQGLLYLPLSPIYGLGATIMTLFLIPYVHEPILLFFAALLLGSVLEYAASFIMEKVFKTVFWDYSDYPFNIQGRICLQYAIFWGLLGLVLIYVINPWLIGMIAAIPHSWSNALGIVLGILTILSTILTLLAFVAYARKVEIIKTKKRKVFKRKPLYTRRIRFIDVVVPEKVMINTFPRMSSIREYQSLTGHHHFIIRTLMRVGKQSVLRARLREIRDTIDTILPN